MATEPKKIRLRWEDGMELGFIYHEGAWKPATKVELGGGKVLQGEIRVSCTGGKYVKIPFGT